MPFSESVEYKPFYYIFNGLSLYIPQLIKDIEFKISPDKIIKAYNGEMIGIIGFDPLETEGVGDGKWTSLVLSLGFQEMKRLLDECDTWLESLPPQQSLLIFGDTNHRMARIAKKLGFEATVELMDPDCDVTIVVEYRVMRAKFKELAEKIEPKKLQARYQRYLLGNMKKDLFGDTTEETLF